MGFDVQNTPRFIGKITAGLLKPGNALPAVNLLGGLVGPARRSRGSGGKA
jgi:hypothetical protein